MGLIFDEALMTEFRGMAEAHHLTLANVYQAITVDDGWGAEETTLGLLMLDNPYCRISSKGGVQKRIVGGAQEVISTKSLFFNHDTEIPTDALIVVDDTHQRYFRVIGPADGSPELRAQREYVCHELPYNPDELAGEEGEEQP